MREPHRPRLTCNAPRPRPPAGPPLFREKHPEKQPALYEQYMADGGGVLAAHIRGGLLADAAPHSEEIISAARQMLALDPAQRASMAALSALPLFQAGSSR